MGYRKKYTRTGETNIPTYNWEDLADGTGVIGFYGIPHTSGGINTLLYGLHTTAINPGYTSPTSVVDHERIGSITGGTKKFYLSPLNASRIIKGKVYFNATLATTSAGSGDAVPYFSLYKNSNQLLMVSGAAVGGVSTVRTYNLIADLPNTHVSVGDVLSVHVSGAITGGTQLFLCHDPQNNDIPSYAPAGGVGTLPAITAATNTTTFKSYIPFKIER